VSAQCQHNCVAVRLTFDFLSYNYLSHRLLWLCGTFSPILVLWAY